MIFLYRNRTKGLCCITREETPNTSETKKKETKHCIITPREASRTGQVKDQKTAGLNNDMIGDDKEICSLLTSSLSGFMSPIICKHLFKQVEQMQ